MKILVLSQDISLLNIVDYILYKDYKVVKSTSIENLESGIDDFNLIIFDFNYWLNNIYPTPYSETLKKTPLIILTEDKSSDALRVIKQEYHAKIILKEPLVKKDLKEAIKDLLKKKKSKKNKEEHSVKIENIDSSSDAIIEESDIVVFRTNDFDGRKIEYISNNFYKLTGIHEKPAALSEIIHTDDISRFADIKVSDDSPSYSLVYRIITAHNKEIIIKETGKANFDGRDYLTNVEGTLQNYTSEYIKENLILFLSDIFSKKADNVEALLTKLVNDFAAIPFFRNQIQLSIAFSNKHYFAEGFEATDYSVSSPIEQDGKNAGEIILFANDDNNLLDDSLKAFTDLLKNFILLYSSYYRQHSSAKNQIETLTNEFNTLVSQFSQTKSALADKSKSFDNLNEIFNSAAKDYKILNSKLNRSIVIFETNNTGKFLSANENYYRAIEGQRDHMVGKHFDELFENINWESLQFEFFNNANQEINLKQKSKQGKAHYFTFLISREENDGSYKYVFYGNDKTDVKSLQIQLAKQVTYYNNTVAEFVQLKDKSASLENENTVLKEELRQLKEAQLKAAEESAIEREKEIEEAQIEQSEENNHEESTQDSSAQENIEAPAEETPENEEIFKNLRGIDFNKGLESAHNNMDTYNEILVNFLNDYSEFVQDIKENHLTNQKDEILSKLQILSEEAGYIGAEDLDNSARLFHDKLNDNKVTNFDFELSVLGVHLNFTLESIKKYKAEYSLEHHKKEESSLISEPVTENIDDVFEPKREVTSDSRIDLLLIDIKDLLSSENPTEETAALIKEKLFELKFHNSDIGKIEKIQELELSIETGDSENAIRALNELLKF